METVPPDRVLSVPGNVSNGSCQRPLASSGRHHPTAAYKRPVWVDPRRSPGRRQRQGRVESRHLGCGAIIKTSATAGLGRKQLRTLRRERPLGPHTTGRAPCGGHAPRCSGQHRPPRRPAKAGSTSVTRCRPTNPAGNGCGRGSADRRSSGSSACLELKPVGCADSRRDSFYYAIRHQDARCVHPQNN